MSEEFIMQMRPLFEEEEKKAICDYMDEDGFITEFKRTEIFEKMIANYTSSKHCVVVNNGTISLTLAALSLDIKPGDEIIVPNYTMIASPNSIQMIGAVPVFADVERDSLCLDLDSVKDAISPRTKAIMLVSSNGRYPKKTISAFEKLAEEYEIHIIEDSAQSLGSFYPDGRHVGTAGTVGSFSFSAPKIISTGQGGALVTNDNEVAAKIRKLKDFGRASGGNDIHDVIGYNFKFTELQACIGIEQMKKLEKRVERKKEIWSKYRNEFQDISEINLFSHNLKYTAPWFIDATVERREDLMRFLKLNNIGTRVMYPPINKQKAYSQNKTFPVSDLIGTNGLWFPSSVQLSNTQIKYIGEKVREFYNN